MAEPAVPAPAPRPPWRGSRPRGKGLPDAPWRPLAAGAVIFVLALLLIEKLGIL